MGGRGFYNHFLSEELLYVTNSASPPSITFQQQRRVSTTEWASGEAFRREQWVQRGAGLFSMGCSDCRGRACTGCVKT